MRIGKAEGCVEFICRGERAGIAAIPLTHPLPRKGEEVVFDRNGQRTAFTVLEVSYLFEKEPEWAEHAPQRLTKVIVKVEAAAGDSTVSALDYT